MAQATPQTLTLELLSVCRQLHPEYSHNEELAWVCGFLAKYVLRKNHMDNIVYAELNHELNLLLERSDVAETTKRYQEGLIKLDPAVKQRKAY